MIKVDGSGCGSCWGRQKKEMAVTKRGKDLGGMGMQNNNINNNNNS